MLSVLLKYESLPVRQEKQQINAEVTGQPTGRSQIRNRETHKTVLRETEPRA